MNRKEYKKKIVLVDTIADELYKKYFSHTINSIDSDVYPIVIRIITHSIKADLTSERIKTLKQFPCFTNFIKQLYYKKILTFHQEKSKDSFDSEVNYSNISHVVSCQNTIRNIFLKELHVGSNKAPSKKTETNNTNKNKTDEIIVK